MCRTFLACLLCFVLANAAQLREFKGEVGPEETLAGSFKVASGTADVTGPATEVDFMGYAFPGQTGRGIHYRLRARAFIVEDTEGNRVVYVSADLCMAMMSMKFGVVEKLQQMYGTRLYTHDNVMISGIHTHSGPGGYSWFMLYDISMLGFHKDHLEAVVDGLTRAIVRAHNKLASATLGTIRMAHGTLLDSNINRSPSSYLANPASERANYAYDVDKDITVLRFTDGSGADVGALTIFAGHCTSMHNTNRLVSGDNKGMASYLFEQAINGPNVLPGQGSFVAAFGQTNEGDVSPNTQGAWCDAKVGGISCSNDHSICNGRNEKCYGVGPAGFVNETGSNSIIGGNQFKAAMDLFNQATEQVVGKVAFAHQWINISQYVVTPQFSGLSRNITTCRPAVGFSFAAGTTDGPGAFNFQQGDNCTSDTCNPLWKIVKNFLKAPTQEQIQCQAPKPILLDVGEIEPFPWVPLTVPVQMFKIGQVVIAAVPGEFTTMAGRRLRNTIRDTFAARGQNVTVLIAGLANTYTQYISTIEEYEWQRYESASTLYGPQTLNAYRQVYAGLATSIITSVPVDPGTAPNKGTRVNILLQPPPIVDIHPFGKPFGTVDKEPQASYTVGSHVNVTFWGGNLRNNYTQEGTFLSVERSEGANWRVVATDGNIETTLYWERVDIAMSLVTVGWTIPQGTQAGTYRIRHFGYAKVAEVSQEIKAYEGATKSFTVA